MVIHDGKIVELTEEDLFCLYLDREMDLCMDFFDYRNRMEAAGTRIVSSKEVKSNL